MGSGAVVLLDSFTRVHETVHRTLGDITPDELIREPHPSIGWLAWRLTRVMDSIPSALSNREQLWIESWAAKFGMAAERSDFGRAHSHNREQVRAFKAPADLILAYHDAVFARVADYIGSITDEELARVLDEPQYDPIPTVSVRIVSCLENLMHNAGMIVYLKTYHRLGGWFPAEAPDRSLYR